MEQTAVEWFNEEINKLNVGTDARIFIAKLFEKAKEMENQRLKDAYAMGREGKTIAEFNETFKSE